MHYVLIYTHYIHTVYVQYAYIESVHIACIYIYTFDVRFLICLRTFICMRIYTGSTFGVSSISKIFIGLDDTYK